MIRRPDNSPRTLKPNGGAQSLQGQSPWVRDDRYSLALAAMLWIMIPYLVIPSDIFSVDKNGAEAMATANPISRAIKLGLLGIGVIAVLSRRSLARNLARNTNMFFLVFLVAVPASSLWSIASGATIARYISILSIVGAAVAFVLSSWHAQRFQNVMRPVTTALLIGTLIFGIARPDLVIEVGEGTLKNSWHGLTSQKNQLGQLASFGLIFWAHAWLTGQRKSLVSLIGVGASGACLILSRSSTSLLASILVIMLMLMALKTPPNLRRYMPYVVVLFAALVVTYAVAVLKLLPGLDILLTPITSITGKDLTFSNRSEIWAIVKEHIDLYPYLGSGYGAYWIGPVPWSPSYTFLSRMWFYPSESHNGYLESINDLGYLGLTILLGYLFVFVRHSLEVMRYDRGQGVLYLSLFFHQAIINLSESAWLQINALAFIFMTIATFSLARTRLEYRLQSAYSISPVVDIPLQSVVTPKPPPLNSPLRRR